MISSLPQCLRHQSDALLVGSLSSTNNHCLLAKYFSNDLYTRRVNCSQANVIVLMPNIKQQSITVFNCSALTKNEIKLVLVGIINKTVRGLNCEFGIFVENFRPQQTA